MLRCGCTRVGTGTRDDWSRERGGTLPCSTINCSTRLRLSRSEGCWQFEFDENGDAENWGETMRRRAEDWVRERLRDAEREIR